MKRTSFNFLFILIVLFYGGLIGCAIDDSKITDDNVKKEDEDIVNEAVLIGKYSDVRVFDDEELEEDSLYDVIMPIVSINYDGETVTVENPYENDGINITCDGANVTVNAVREDFIAYRLSGNSENGSFRFYSKKKYKLEFDNLNLKSSNGSAINIQSKKRGFIEIIGDCKLEDTETGYSSANESEDSKGTFFSEGQLIFCGSGTLFVIGNEKHAIGNDDYIRWNNATLKIISAKNDGIHVNDMMIVNSGNIEIVSAGKNGIECEKGGIVFTGGNIEINSENDAIKASYEKIGGGINPYIIINNAIVRVKTTGTEKAHGICTESSVVINNNANVNIEVNGNASKGIKSGGLILVGSTVDGDDTYINIKVNGDYVVEDDGVAEPVGIKAGTSYEQKSGHVRIANRGKCGRGIAASGNMELTNCKIYTSLTGSYFTNDENADYNGYPKALKVKGEMSVDNTEIVIYSVDGKGISVAGNLSINSGNIDIEAGHEGIESETFIDIKGGKIYVKAGDDAVNVGGSAKEAKAIKVSGGYVYAESKCDVFDSNGYIYFDGGICVLVRLAVGGDSVIDPGDGLANKGIGFNGGIVLAIGATQDMWSKDILTKYTGNNVIINNSDNSFNNLAAVDANGKLLSYYNGIGSNVGVLYSGPVSAKLYKSVQESDIVYSYNDEKYADKGTVTGGVEIIHSIINNNPNGSPKR